MKDNFVIKASLLFILNILIITPLIQPVSATNANPYVSQENMETHLRKKPGDVTHYCSNNKCYYDLDKIDIKILKVKVVPMYDEPNYFLDDSDLVIIDFEITNNGIDYFVLFHEMFEIRVYDPRMPQDALNNDYSYIVDNYSTIIDDKLETIYDDLQSFEIFEDCDDLHARILLNQSKTFTICFDILRRWNNEVLNLNGPKPHYLTLNDNKYYTSCPNCIKILLTSDLVKPDSVFAKNHADLRLESPLKQIKAGKSPSDVVCKDDLILVLRPGTNLPACVSNDTAVILLERGWKRVMS